MKSLKRILLLLVLCSQLACLLVGALSLRTAAQLQQHARQVFDAKDLTADILPPPMYLIEARLALSQALEGTTPAAEAATTFDRLIGEYKLREAHWKANPPAGLPGPLLQAQHLAAAEFMRQARALVLQPVAGGQVEQARARLAEVHKLYEQHRAGVDATVQASNALAEQAIGAFDQAELQGRHATGAGVVLTLAAGLGLFVFARHRIVSTVVQPLQEASRAAEGIAGGALVQAIGVHGRDEARSLLQGLGRMQHQLVQVVCRVDRSSQAIAQAAAQMAAGAAELGQRSGQQAASLRDASAMAAQLNQGLQGDAATVGDATRSVGTAVAAANDCGHAMAHMVGTMQGIDTSARQIADITALIDTIAFETKILALNAAVEAAHAGPQGRGFAVVAGEIQTLAARCATAAGEIRQLLAHSVAQSRAGLDAVGAAGQSTGVVVAQMQRLQAMMQGIDEAIARRATGVAEVSQALAALDQATQHNTRLAHDSAHATRSLAEQVQVLEANVAQFVLPPAA